MTTTLHDAGFHYRIFGVPLGALALTPSAASWSTALAPGFVPLMMFMRSCRSPLVFAAIATRDPGDPGSLGIIHPSPLEGACGGLIGKALSDLSHFCGISCGAFSKSLGPISGHAHRRSPIVVC